MRYALKLPMCLFAGLVLTGGLVPTVNAAEVRCAVLEVFVKGTSERSAEARAYVEKAYGSRKGVNLVIRDVIANNDDLDRFWKIAETLKIADPGLPAFYVSGKFEYGWDANVTPGLVEQLLTVEVFLRNGCPRCAQAKPIIFNELAPSYPGYKFVEKEIVTVAANNARLFELAAKYRQGAASVPALHFCGKLQIGFYDANTSRKQWNDVLKAVTVVCAADAPAPPPPMTDPQSRRWQRRDSFRITPVGWFGSVAYAGEPLVAIAPNSQAAAAPPDPDVGLPIPPEVEAAPANDNADAPPPRPRRSLPPEVSASTEQVIDPVHFADDPQQSDYRTIPLLGEVNWRAWGLPAFTLMVGLIDGFNPCAMWVLMFLLSLLVNLRDRWKILAVAGSFVVISGVAYFAFMAAWLNVMLLAPLQGKAQMALGVLGIIVGLIHIKDFFAFKKGVSLSIPESAKPRLYERMRKIVMAESLWGAIVGASTLAVLVNIVELLCTAGLPAMYTGVLTMQNYPWWQNYLYLLLYIAAYMFDDALLVAVVVTTLGKHRLQETGGRVLKLISGTVILAIGATMLLKPEWLV
ncbi:MAG: hypothetical protein SH850_07850 [Planctomycetaceae bacterium]|nr:hypothetical protein [Planctomycetaceae bacterium]